MTSRPPKERQRTWRYTHNPRRIKEFAEADEKKKVTLLLTTCMNCPATKKSCKKCIYRELAKIPWRKNEKTF
jgi:hypothetical protein